jgi:hypothetical protein
MCLFTLNHKSHDQAGWVNATLTQNPHWRNVRAELSPQSAPGKDRQARSC